MVLNGSAFEWSHVTSGVPEVSVFGTTCFVIFINDNDDVLNLVDGFVSKFADDAKYRVIQNFASPSRAEMGQTPVKLTISPSNTFNLNWENQILDSETFYNC